MDNLEILENVKGKFRNMFLTFSASLDSIVDKEGLKTFIQTLNQTDFKQEIINAINAERADRTARIESNQQQLLELDEVESKLDALME